MSKRKRPANAGKTTSRASRSRLSRQPVPTIGNEGTARREAVFVYNVEWEEVPFALVNALDDAESRGAQVNADVLTKLQKWLAADLFAKSVTCQVVTEKYPLCMKVMSDGQLIDSGYDTFLNTFAHMMEHKGRSVPNVERVHPNAAIATGAVVVQEQMFNPHLEEEEISDQKDMKDRLSEIFHTYRETEWPTLEIDKLMHQSYGLQRHDIIHGTRIIEETKDADDPGSTENNQQCIERLRAEWPFLFQTRWQSAHYLQLTAAPIDLAIAQYAEEHLTLIMDYLLTNNTDTAIKCLILKKQWEAANSNPKTRFMLAATMIATYFQEDIKSFFLKAERTTQPTEVHRLEGISGALTVVALNQNIFLATKFFVCMDQRVVLEAYTSEEAIKSVIQAAFIFSTHYPSSLKHTFEFLERIVCKLTSSRLSEPILVMTPIVLRLINGIRKFQEKCRILSESI